MPEFLRAIQERSPVKCLEPAGRHRRCCCALPHLRLRVGQAGRVRGTARRPRYAGSLGPVATRPLPPTPPVLGSRDARAPLTGPGGVRQVVVGRSPGKLPQFPAAQAQHPGDRRLFQGSVDRAAPRARARTWAQPGARPTGSTRKVSPGRHRARVLRSRYHSHQARGRHFPADNSLARRSAHAPPDPLDGRGKGLADPGQLSGTRWAQLGACPAHKQVFQGNRADFPELRQSRTLASLKGHYKNHP